MSLLATVATYTVVLIAFAFLLWTLRKTVRSTLNTVWALFCASLALTMLDRAAGAELGALRPLAQIASGATCGMFWLVARCLFRSEKAIAAPHWMLVAAILLPTAIVSMLMVLPISPDSAVRSTAIAGLRDFQLLFSSTAMVLSAWEGLNGWHAQLDRSERNLRVGYFATIGSCVILSQSFNPSADAAPILHSLETLLHALCAIAVLVVAGAAVSFRKSHPLAKGSTVQTLSRVAPTADEHVLASRIELLMRQQSVYLQPELKVATVAEELQVPEYRVSRAVCGVLGFDNFNQFINRYRIEYAQQLLAADESGRSILAIGIDSGFASIGPFNRAFKAITGITPRQFRANLADSAESEFARQTPLTDSCGSSSSSRFTQRVTPALSTASPKLSEHPS